MKYDNENLLSMIELYADEVGNIASEQELSDLFDDQVAPAVIEQYGKIGEQFDDQNAIDEEFNNWSDSLCKDGEIHPEQYNEYCYIGKYSEV